MKLFKRNSSSTPDPDEFSRAIIHQILAIRYWGQSVVVMHEELEGQHLIRLNHSPSYEFDSNEWESFDFETAEKATKKMMSLRQNVRSLLKEFPEAGLNEIPAWKKDWDEVWGFSDLSSGTDPVRFLKIVRGELPMPAEDNLDTLSLGNTLAAILEDDSYYPRSTNEVNLFWTYLGSARLDVGFFGNFKFITKRLTDRFDYMAEHCDEETTSYLAGSLGSAYGQVEGYLSKGNLSPMSFITRDSYFLKGLLHLPEFGGKSYISTATAQYLARKGLRLMKKLEAEYASLVVTRFKVNLLYTADFADQRSSRFPDRQLIVNDIIYRDTDLSSRDRSGRRSLLASTESLDEFEIPESHFSDLSEDEKTVWTKFLENIEGKNQAITRYAFEASELLGIEFAWNDATLKTLSNSSSEKIQAAILKFLSENLTKFFVLELPDQVKYLRLLPEERLSQLFAVMGYNSWGLAGQWALEATSRELDARDILVSRLLLTHQRGRINSYTLYPFLVNLAKYSQFQPFDDWKKVITLASQNVYWSSPETIAKFFGADSEPGIFTVLQSPTLELIELYAKDAATILRWTSQEGINSLLGKLLDSKVPALRSMVSLIVRKKLMSDEQISRFTEARRDPSLSLLNLTEAIAENDQASVLDQLTMLSKEDSQVFWRMQGKEAEKAFRDWKEFPKFFWTNLHQLPLVVVETIQAYDWLSSALRSQISPGSIAKMKDAQSELFASFIKKDKAFLESDAMLRAVLIAPNAKVNEFGAKYLKETGRYSEFWLLMLESNLPVTSHAAYEFLRGQSGKSDFADKLLMALDSNNRNARNFAKQLLAESASPKVLVDVIQKLVENRNSDTWHLVSKNLELLKEKSSLQSFTRRVFLTRRQARTEKESIKLRIEKLVEDISEVVEKDILIRMSFSSVSKDREWALRQIAQSNLTDDEVIVESSWRGPANV